MLTVRILARIVLGGAGAVLRTADRAVTIDEHVRYGVVRYFFGGAWRSGTDFAAYCSRRGRERAATRAVRGRLALVFCALDGTQLVMLL